MNHQHYNREAAKQALEDAIKESKEFLTAQDDASVQHLSGLDVDRFAVQATGGRTQIWRLGPTGQDGTIEEELALHMQGILLKSSFRPGDVSGLDFNKASSISQQITVGGIGSAAFNEGVVRLQDLHALFGRHFPANALHSWETQCDGGDPVLNASTRYFTAVADDPTAVHIPFENGVDPLKKLERFVGDQLVHTPANVVKYYRRTKQESTDTSGYVTETVQPSQFRVGDIIEVDISVFAFQSAARKSTIKMHCNLNSVTLLNGSFAKAAEEAKRDAIPAATVLKTALRRRNPYADEDDKASKKTKDAVPGSGTG
ncbi:hypothetical protein DFH06DRAFT_1346789 [Mycena polygramma]|nr:hypothetical protein DFH06DRAFT_1346789 [Mycena polygramma]